MVDKRNFLYEFKRNKILFVMAVPSVVFFIIICYLPMVGIYMAFTQYDMRGGVFGSPFVGFDNFRFLILSGQLFTITRNTILYNVVFQILGSAAQIAAAIFLSEISGKYFKKIAQSIIFLPYFVSFVLIGTFIYQIFNYEFGSFNSLLKSLNLQPVDAYSNTGIWKYIIVFFFIWKNTGYGMIIYLATIVGISSEYYEAAKIDGANIFKQIRYITLPMIKPTFIILTLFAVGNILKGQFQLFYQIIGNNGILFNSTDIIDTFVFRSLTNMPNYGLATAAGLYQSLFGFLLIILVNYTINRINPEYALF